MEKLYRFWCLLCIMKIVCCVQLKLPINCLAGEYYEPSLLSCQACPVNASLVTSVDGFGCTCGDHSVPVGLNRCKKCNATEMVSTDGTVCVPRHCQNTAGRYVCRKCPNDYISVTQNIDGSALKEVQCVKCARGYKAENNVCIRCESCTCKKQQIIVRGICVPRSYVNSRPKYKENSLHPLNLLDIVKHEYLCTQNDFRACRTLASECVKNFYSVDPAGPCRLWIQSNISVPKDLPPLTVQSSLSDKYPGETNLIRAKDFMKIVAAIYTSDGGFKFLKDPSQRTSQCSLPINIKIGDDYKHDCKISLSNNINDDLNATISPYLYTDGNIIQIPVYPRKPNGYSVQTGAWLSSKFKRYFILERSLSTTANTTVTVYLQSMNIKIQVERDKRVQGSLKVYITIEVNYSKKSSLSDTIVTTLKVTHEMPEAGIHRGIEIWSGVLGSLSTLYAMVQWRSIVRRGGLYLSIIPLLVDSIADTLYFATWFSTLHALAAEAGTLGITLPLARIEEQIIMTLIYSAVSLKVIKVVWFNVNQCRCDIFFLDWSQYNPPYKDSSAMDKSDNWRAATLAREWSRLQTIRRVSPDLTAILTLIIMHVLTPWQAYLPKSLGYKWAVASIAWWLSYTLLLLARAIIDRLFCSSVKMLPKLCNSIGFSLLVFEEEYYAHYVHGRNDNSQDVRSMVGPLAMCRLVCAPQLRVAFKQLSNFIPGLGERGTKQALLSQFLGAFFERALDGLSWVASERTSLERLLNIELATRESGNTSTLLYDPSEDTPSCFKLTWWGEEWTLATFDAMVFGSTLIAMNDTLLAFLVTLIVWQIMKLLRRWFGNKNQRCKTEIEI